MTMIVPWWAVQEQGNPWFCGLCQQRTPLKTTAPHHKPGCPYALPLDGTAEGPHG